MSTKTIEIQDHILTRNLFSECGYNEEKSAENYKEQFINEMTEKLYNDFPGAILKFDVSIQNASGCSRSLEVLVSDSDDEDWEYEDKGEEYGYIAERVYESFSWAVEEN